MTMVRAVACPHNAEYHQVFDSLAQATAPLSDTWKRIESARTVVVKLNQAWPNAQARIFRGHHQEHVDERVARAALMLLKERTRGRIIVCDISVEGGGDGIQDYTLLPLFRELGVDIVDGDKPPFTLVNAQHPDSMFKHYMLPECVAHADAIVSVQKIKNHKSMGITLSLKNLFGLLVRDPWFHGRHYFHHFVRLPHVLADLGAIMKPCLNILDGLSSQSGSEWAGRPLITNTLVCGDNTVSTDAMTAHLMGYNPLGNYPSSPYIRDCNHLGIAHRMGIGSANRAEIDYQSTVKAPIGQFYVQRLASSARAHNWLKTTCEQALYYRDHIDHFTAYSGRYILLQDNAVRWVGDTARLDISRSSLSGSRPDSAMYLKYVDLDEIEDENYAIYEQLLRQLSWVERTRHNR